jgi:hypothetical protein
LRLLADQLDPVAVRVADEADPVALGTAAGAVRRLLRLDALGRELLEGAVEVVDGDRDVVVAGAEVVGVDPVVVGQLEAGSSPGSPMKTLIASSPIGIRRRSSKPSFS